MNKQEFKKKGGSWLGAARSWIQWHCNGGDQVTWGSDTELKPAITVAQVEDIAGDAAFAVFAQQQKSVEVYSVSVSYPYKSEEGEIFEHSLYIDFCAADDIAALRAAIKWAQNRYEAIIKDMYQESFIGCIKLGTKMIGSVQEDGSINTRRGWTFFEWKFDWPSTINEAVEEFVRKRENKK